jgi:hypothetical protein
MEILIKTTGRKPLGRCITSTDYIIYSIDKLYKPQINSLIHSVDSGQDISFKEIEINETTSVSYKYRYDVNLICDSSD